MKSGFAKLSDFYKYERFAKMLCEVTKYNSRRWEDLFALGAFASGGLAETGGRALGFGVGMEFTPSVLAALGVEVVATDQAESAGWGLNRDHMTTKAGLRYERLVSA